MRTKEDHRGLTAIELVVVLAIVTLMVGVLTPALHAGRNRSRDAVCLDNLRSLGVAVRTYADEYHDVLPGPAHPAIFLHYTLQSLLDAGYTEATAKRQRQRQLTWLLASVLGDGVIDRSAVCPVMSGIAPEEHFYRWQQAHGYYVFPIHYVLNNWGTSTSEGYGLTDNIRETEPPYYFGLSPYIGASFDPTPPHPIGLIDNPADEWMIADAWYRSRTGSLPEFQQEGPYQSGWSGSALPHFAPHFKKGLKSPVLNTDERQVSAASVRAAKTDGITNTAFFDGHAAGVPSRTFMVGDFDILYGFPGTVNPHLSANTQAILQQVGGGTWE